MVQSKATTAQQYLKELPAEKQAVIKTIRKTIADHLPKGYKEGVQYGMICYSVPLSRYPEGYLKNREQPLPYVALAAQKNYYAIYFTGIYANKKIEQWFAKAYKDSGKKLDMGKSCLRFKKIDDLALDVIGEAIAKISVDDFIALYESNQKKK